MAYLKEGVLDGYLARKNISKHDFADRIGITPTHLSNIIGRRHSPKPELRNKIMEVLEVDTWDELFEMSA